MSRYLVTGATGFLGRHLTRALTAQGHEVLALARTKSEPLEGAKYVQGDVLDAAAIETAAKGCAGVFHCAGKVSRDPRDAESMWQLHVIGTRNVMEASRRAGVKRVVIASTSGTVALN